MSFSTNLSFIQAHSWVNTSAKSSRKPKLINESFLRKTTSITIFYSTMNINRTTSPRPSSMPVTTAIGLDSSIIVVILISTLFQSVSIDPNHLTSLSSLFEPFKPTKNSHTVTARRSIRHCRNRAIVRAFPVQVSCRINRQIESESLSDNDRSVRDKYLFLTRLSSKAKHHPRPVASRKTDLV